MTKSKNDLINKLMNLYPYSREWFEAQTEKKLWAMYYSYKPKSNQAFQTEESLTSIKVDSGITYILTDAGVYEEMYD